MADDLRAVHFPYWFDFVRLSSQPYRDASGADAVAPAGEPRFDHDGDGTALGLLIDAGQSFGTGDRATLKAGVLDEAAGEPVTVLHAYQGAAGIERRAWYGRNARAIVNGLVAVEARHVSVGVVPGFLVNKGGYVRQRGHSWFVANVIGVDDGIGLSDGNRALIDQ